MKANKEKSINRKGDVRMLVLSTTKLSPLILSLRMNSSPSSNRILKNKKQKEQK